MVEMILYSITIMYTPGPVTITAANLGLNRKFKEGIPFYAGVSLAIFVLYILFGFFGSMILPSNYLWLISLIGALYMLYLAYKVYHSNTRFNSASKSEIGFTGGFFMQFFNPKAIIAVMPVITIYFPQLHINGIQIIYMAVFFTLLVFGAPASYAFIGQFCSHLIENEKTILLFNRTMALILAYIAISTLYHYVLL